MSETYVLRSENLTHLGGPMGTEYTYDNWVKYFSNQAAAKHFAERDYRQQSKTRKSLEWIEDEDGIRTEDLRFVMYHIARVKVEE